MTEQKKPADGELIFAAGLLGGSLNYLKSSEARAQVKRVMYWLISFTASPRRKPTALVVG